VIDSVTDPLNQLHKTFGAQLYSAAERLVDIGCVFDVRILQAGATVTGTAGTDPQATPHAAKHRVYIRYQNQTGQSRAGRLPRDDASQGLDGLTIEGECSCGERSPCIHIAAVSIAAAKNARKPPIDHRHTGIVPSPQRSAYSPTRSAPVLQQQLCYLFSKPVTSGLETTGEFQLSVWVGQSAAGGRIDPDNAHRFSPRPSAENNEFPRYVDAQDRKILQALIAQHIDGPWELRGAAGADLLLQAVATGRAHWQSLQVHALRSGNPRQVRFVWSTLPNGDQRLRCEIPATVDIDLSVEPAIYIDAAVNECGQLELPCPASLLQQYWNRPAIAPEQVAAVNEQISRHDEAATFPRPRTLSVQRQTLSSLQARLVLSAGPESTLHFVYNGLAIDSRSLRAEQDTVRVMAGDILHEVERDRDAERQLLARLGAARHRCEAWLTFMTNTVPALQAEGWEIVIDPGFPYRIAAPGNWYGDLAPDATPAVRKDSQREWFDLRLGILVDGHPINLLPALAAYLQESFEQTSFDKNDPSCCRVGEQLFVRLDDGRYVPLAIERIQRIADTLVELFDRNGLNQQQALSLPLSQASRLVQLTQELQEPNGPALRSEDPALLALINDLKNFSAIEPLSAPAHFQATLRPYQQEGLGWLQFLRRYRLGGILADDMGLGKTVQTLAHLVLEKEQGRLRKPSLIVAPVSVIGNWQQEIRRFAPELKLLTLHGARRKELFHAIERADIVITGYPLLQFDSEVLLAREFCFLILDEAQMIKNPRAKVSQAARALRAEHRLCLTGTPMENHLGELWSLFDFLQPGWLGDEKEFQRQYRTPIEKNGDKNRSAALARRIAPFILRRTKDAVARELPPKTQIVESIVLDERQRDFYDGIRLAMHQRVREIIQLQGLARSHITVLDALLKLRQACCDPRLVSTDAETQTIPSAKLEWLSTVLPELVAEGRRILLFSQFTSMLQLIEAAVTDLSIPYCLLTGATQNRAAVVERFQAGAVPLFLISLKAGGTGLNLTAADTVIHYDPWWNPAVEAQATDRAHRIGQDQPVFVYKLIAQGTVEEKIMQLQADKHALANQLYTDQSALPGLLNAVDLEALFAP
jgi:superfamily II DNA or RNA helicase